MSPLLSSDDAGEILAKPVGEVIEKGSWFVWTTRGFFVTGDPKKVTWEQWWRRGQRFRRVETSFKFAVADWLRFGGWRFREKFAQAQALFPFWDEQTLMNIQRVGNRVPPSRRREELPFEYHEAVAGAKPQQQKQMLDAATKDDTITRQVLRDMTHSYEQPDPERARIEFQAVALRRAISEVDQAILRLEGEARRHAMSAVDELRQALRLVSEKAHAPKDKAA